MATKAVRALAVNLQTPKALPPLLWGKPGIAKSASFEQIAKRFAWDLRVLVGGLREPADFGGYPTAKDGALHFLPIKDLVDLNNAKNGGVLFLDELSSCPPAVQAAMMRLALERKAGDYELSEKVIIGAAANPADVAANGFELADPLANRFTHHFWNTPDVDTWADWATGVNTMTDVPVLDKARFDEKLDAARAEVIAYMKRNPESLRVDRQKDGAPAFATPRTWASAIQLIAGARASDASDVELDLISGSVGEGVATTFCQWRLKQDLPDPEQVLKDPESFSHDKTRPDRTHAVILATSMAATRELKDKKQNAERWHQGWAVVLNLKAAGKDVILPGLRILVKKWPSGVMLTKPEQTLVDEVRPVLKASGLLSEGK